MEEEKLEKEIYDSLNCKHEITKEFIKTVIEAIKNFERKQEIFTTNNISDSGEIGLVTRIGDFLSEVKKYLAVTPEKRKELSLTDEKMTKNFFNIGIYGLIAYIFRNGKWK
jgi:hypothetical protein